MVHHVEIIICTLHITTWCLQRVAAKICKLHSACHILKPSRVNCVALAALSQECFLHARAFTQESFDTEYLLNTEAFTHKYSYANMFLHRNTCIQRVFLHRYFYKAEVFSHGYFYTEMLLHTQVPLD